MGIDDLSDVWKRMSHATVGRILSGATVADWPAGSSTEALPNVNAFAIPFESFLFRSLSAYMAHGIARRITVPDS